MVTARQVAKARVLMGEGYSMREAAIVIGVRSSELDQAMWSLIGVDLSSVAEPQRPTPMF